MTPKRKDASEILGAARECVLAYGAQRTTLTEVARRAGVSRPTVYAHWPDVKSLLADLITAELGQIAQLALDPPGRGTARKRLVGAIVEGVRVAIGNPLMVKIMDTDPELLIPYVIDRFGTSQRAVLSILETGFAENRADGSVRSDEPAVLARMVLLMVQSTVLSHRLVADTMSTERLATELGVLVDGYLRPAAKARIPSARTRKTS